MCGRYYRRSDKQRLGDAFNIGDLPSSLVISEDYNVAPTTFQPVIRNDKETGERELVLMRWGTRQTHRQNQETVCLQNAG
jgi:putative SOS response-associated peptidase YedK